MSNPGRLRDAALEFVAQAASPSAPGTPNVYVSSGDGKLHYKDASNVDTVVGGSGGVSSVATGNGLQGGPITTSGTVDLRLNAAGALSKTLGAGNNELGIAATSVQNGMLVNSAITVNASGGVLGGGVTSLGTSVNLSVDPTVVPKLAAANTFTNTNVFQQVTTIGGGKKETLLSKSGSYTILITDTVIGYDTTGGSFGLTLPAPNAVGAGWEIRIFDAANSSNLLSVIRNGGEKINFVAGSYSMPSASSRTFYTNGTDWFVH